MSAMFPKAALWLAAALLGSPAFSQPAKVPKINPATGLPETSSGELAREGAAKPPSINPATSLPASSPLELTPEGAGQAEYETATEVQKLIANQRYEEALQRCLAFHERWQTSASLIPLLRHWIDLGQRYPKAKAALVEIRDHDVREFSEGRGFCDLFREVSNINDSLHQEDATYALYKSFRDKDPQLAQQCYGMVEGLLAAKGDYQWCYDHMGDAQAKFDSIRQFMRMRLDQEERSAAQAEASRKRLAEFLRQRGLTNTPRFSPPDTSAMRKSAEDSFVGQIRQLIEILVATGHKADAEKIRAQAVAVLDDPRLKSAVSDAEQKTKASPPASR